MYEMSWSRKYTGNMLVCAFLWGAAVGSATFYFNATELIKDYANHKLSPNTDPDTALFCPASHSLH
jgi:hypothetical protein